MSRTHSQLSIAILDTAATLEAVPLKELYRALESEHPRKTIYDCAFRLMQQGLLSQADNAFQLTEDGAAVLSMRKPKRDGVWKLVIFDIPESQRFVRSHLRSRLKALGFQKWQASIWISPYALDPGVEAELKELAKKFFIRLIKVSEINHTEDLEKMFE